MTFVLNTFQNILHIISGGLLGVFVGMSTLSVFEFLFWVLQVPWRVCSGANMTTQQEIVQTQVSHGNTLNIDDISAIVLKFTILMIESSLTPLVKKKFRILLARVSL